jgi:hypothetical protein
MVPDTTARPPVRADEVGSRAGYPACRRMSALPFVKLTLVPLSHAFRRMVWDPDGCDKHGHFYRFAANARRKAWTL